MKRTLLLPLLAAVGLLSFAQSPATSSPSIDGGLLWRISKPGLPKPSYLLGTMHGEDPTTAPGYEYLDTLPTFHRVLSDVDAVAIECNMLDTVALNAAMESIGLRYQAALMQQVYPAYALLPDSIKAYSQIFTSAAEYAYADSCMQALNQNPMLGMLNIPAIQYERLRPMYALKLAGVVQTFTDAIDMTAKALQQTQDLLTQTNPEATMEDAVEAMASETPPAKVRSMDATILLRADTLGKTLLFLETADDQANVFIMLDSCTNVAFDLATQAHALYEFFWNRNHQINADQEHLVEMLQAYTADDLKSVYDNANLNSERVLQNDALLESRTGMLDKRNTAWIEKMEAYSKAQGCLFAVGAMHLAGPKGLIQQLRQRGYTVEPIPLHP